jgi:DNA-binding beta-propeller fold protein YncE
VCIALTFFLAASVEAAAQDTTPALRLQDQIALGAPAKAKGMLFDPVSGDLLIAHGTEITVVDPAARKIVGHVAGFAGAHGIAVDAAGDGFAASGKAAALIEFDPASARTRATVPAGKDAAAVVFDPVSRHVFVMNDDASTITVIDPRRHAAIATIALGGDEGVEAADTDGRGHLFVDHSAMGEVVRIDTARDRVDAAWKPAGCGKLQGLAVAAGLNRVFVSCNNGVLLVLDSVSGRQVAFLSVGQGSGTLLWDATRGRLYSANADGTLSVIEAGGPEKFVVLAPVPTQPGARLGALDPRSGRVFLLAEPARGETDRVPVLLIYGPSTSP